MIEDIGGVTSQLVGVALDAALLRHEVIANNIANVDTPGFQAKRLDFEAQLQGFTQALQGGSDAMLRDRIESLKMALHDSDAMVVTTNEAVELDREMVELTENTLRYQALLQAMGKRGEIIKMAVVEGRR
ncbi:MAG: flagellar basal body rod protein FlgB [Pseudomonadales bacterium]